MINWINVKDQLPENNTKCFVYNKHNDSYDVFMFYNNEFENDIMGVFVSEISTDQYKPITHWIKCEKPE
jgi:hypothetical protein